MFIIKEPDDIIGISLSDENFLTISRPDKGIMSFF